MNKRFQQCPCCGSSSFEIIYKNDNALVVNEWRSFFWGSIDFVQDIHKCTVCGFRFINSLTDGYEEFYRQQEIEAYFELSAGRRNYFRRLRVLLENRGLRLSRDSKILDLGCGGGEWLSCWKNEVFRYGTEINPALQVLIDQNEVTLLDPNNYWHENFDLVSAFDYLEHVEQPQKFLEEVLATIRRPGYLVLSVPDMGKWVARLFGVKYYLYCPMHFSYFNRNSLYKILSRVCSMADIEIFSSPAMPTSVNGLLKWIHSSAKVSPKFNYRIPFGYSASLIALVFLN